MTTRYVNGPEYFAGAHEWHADETAKSACPCDLAESMPVIALIILDILDDDRPLQAHGFSLMRDVCDTARIRGLHCRVAFGVRARVGGKVYLFANYATYRARQS